MPLSDAEIKANNEAMFGCDIHEFMASVHDSLTFKMGLGYHLVVHSILSDAQELLTLDPERARQEINKAKYIIAGFMADRPDAKAA